ncbi:hypothetical protein [Sphingomonas montanisoli]|uniref:Transmembrane protein n=1 Tax=Sphingomonas montanisoli TaxID=2606412 RepID=A0A5D9CC60_9SPHN|nr:hypothetical protein [Sphingomonas montanisoli]TZG28600.1 hypothetical protein FYJ91_00120 [Sphingomonas montanisoli]
MLLAPLRYWRVRHPTKTWWDKILPGVGTIVLTSILLFWPKVGPVFGGSGFLAGLQNLYAILGGFFVTALTLVSTTAGKALSQPLAGYPPVTFGRGIDPIERRRFLCLLFGYLAFSCFALYVAGLLANLIAPGARLLIMPVFHRPAAGLFLLMYNFWLCHVFTATLVGLYYFTDRLQRPDPEIVRDRGSEQVE